MKNMQKEQEIWKESANVLAEAVKNLYPDSECAMRAVNENGFYGDFDLEQSFSNQDLAEVEEEMRRLAKASGSLAKAIKLLSVAGAYLNGDEHNKMLTRIYGISFQEGSELEEYLKQLEEAKARDHRKLGKELELFEIMEEGPGLPFYHPNGLILKNLLIDYWRKIHRREGYQEISTPLMLMRDLWERSSHWDHYRDNMYTTSVDDVDYAIKPMNCPGGMLMYKSKLHSYRELPLRVGELGIVHRAEKSGTLHGLMRARCFTQDDAHIFMREDQVKDEIQGVMRLIDEVYSKFGFPYSIELSTRPENSIGSDEDWELATESLRAAVEGMNKPYTVNEGDGAFYGPKLDFHVKDSIGRTWQCGTIQLDFQLPQRFELDYIGEDGEKHRPIMLHRVVFGSIDRFMGILIEHYAGRFPVWLAPVQVKILPVSDKFMDYARKVAAELSDKDIRVELDDRNEKLGYKIREATKSRVPYMIVIGEKEASNNSVSVRQRDAEPEKADLGEMSIEEFARLCR